MTSNLLRIGSAVFLGILCLTSSAFAQVFPVNEMIINGPPDKCLNIVFLAEGYTAAEMSKFNQDVQNTLSRLFTTPPYREYQSYFNVYAIEVPSHESGTDHPYTAGDCPAGLDTVFADTYFESTFDVAGIHRLLVGDGDIVNTVLFNNVPFWDIGFVVVNTAWYGGAGGAFATYSTHSAAPEIAIHELGHAFAGLADEYEYGGGGGYEAPNATAVTNRDSIKWNIWIEPSTPIPTPETSTYGSVIGLFEGAVYVSTGWYRPKLDCKMRTLGPAFCSVCSEHSIRVIYNLVSALDAWGPADTTLALTDHETVDLVIGSKQTWDHSVATSWYVDDTPVATAVDTFTFDAAQHDSGMHLVSVHLSDTTDFVRKDPDSLLTASAAWSIHVERIIFVLGDPTWDSLITSADVIYLVNYAFKGGPPPLPVEEAGDVNCDGVVTSADVIFLVNYVFKSGLEPVCP